MGSRRMNEPGWCQARCGEVRSGGFWEDPDGAQLGSGKTQTELSLAAVRRFPASSEVAAGAGRQLPHAATPTLRPCSKCPCCGKSTDGAHVAAGIPRESPVLTGGKEKGGWGGGPRDWWQHLERRGGQGRGLGRSGSAPLPRCRERTYSRRGGDTHRDPALSSLGGAWSPAVGASDAAGLARSAAPRCRDEGSAGGAARGVRSLATGSWTLTAPGEGQAPAHSGASGFSGSALPGSFSLFLSLTAQKARTCASGWGLPGGCGTGWFRDARDAPGRGISGVAPSSRRLFTSGYIGFLIQNGGIVSPIGQGTALLGLPEIISDTC